MPERKVLHSWKEISQYMNLGVRTIQRYELHLGLPVHRVAGRSRSAVVAFSDELDAWLGRSPTRNSDSVAYLTDAAQQCAARRNSLEIAARAKGTADRAKAALAITAKQHSEVERLVARARAIQDQYRRPHTARGESFAKSA